MAEKKRPDYIPFFLDDLDALELLGDAERGRLLTALLEYGRLGASEKCSGNERFIYPMFRGRIDRFFQSYGDRCEKNKQNADKRWDAENANACERMQNMPSKSNAKSKSNAESNAETESKSVDTGDTRKRFTPPTLEEVVEYVKERGSNVDAKQFFEYYDAGGWKDAKGNPVRSWKQKLLTWEKHETPSTSSRPKSSNPAIGTPGDYEREAIARLMRRGDE